MGHGTLIVDGARAMGMVLDGAAIDRLESLLALLQKWNAVYNLTALPDVDAWIPGHILDSLSIGPHLNGSHCLDVGTGAGFPGLPLAVAFPTQQWTLVDSSQKKLAFVKQAIAVLKLENANAHLGRVESWMPARRFDAVVSRAFSDLTQFVRSTRHLLEPEGCLYAMKGRRPDSEISDLPESIQCERVLPLSVPGLLASRHLVVLQPTRT